jgi:ferredoxin
MPTQYPVTLAFPDGREVTLLVDEDTFILDAAAEAGVDLPHTCLQGWCLTCAGRTLNGAGECVDNRAALRYYAEDAQAGFVLLCTARPRGPCRILVGQAGAMKAFRLQRGLPAPRG